MKELFDTYGDLVLAIIAAVAFFGFIMTLISDTGMLYQTLQQYENAFCMTIAGRIVV